MKYKTFPNRTAVFDHRVHKYSEKEVFERLNGLKPGKYNLKQAIDSNLSGTGTADGEESNGTLKIIKDKRRVLLERDSTNIDLTKILSIGMSHDMNVRAFYSILAREDTFIGFSEK